MDRIKKNKMWIISVLILVVVIAGGIYAWQHSTATNTKKSYTTGKVTRGNMATIISATGTINPVNAVDVSTKMSGLLKEVRVKENQEVTEGDIIAVIDDKSVTASVEDTKNKMNNALTTFNRNKALYGQDAVSRQVYDDAELAYMTAKTNYEKALGDYDDTIITSPISGTIVGEPLKAGQTVTQGQSSQMIIVTVADVTNLEIKVLVDETDIGNIATGQSVTFTVDAYAGKEFHGVVSDISKGTKGSVSTTSSSVVYYTVKVLVDKDSVDGLLPMMTARTSIHGKEVDDVLLVPLTAIRSDTNGEYVYLIKNGQPVSTHITTGITGNTNVEVLKGLNEGDEVIVSGDPTDTATTSSKQGGMPKL